MNKGDNMIPTKEPTTLIIEWKKLVDEMCENDFLNVKITEKETYIHELSKSIHNMSKKFSQDWEFEEKPDWNIRNEQVNMHIVESLNKPEE